jgi:hypothetical protein
LEKDEFILMLGEKRLPFSKHKEKFAFLPTLKQIRRSPNIKISSPFPKQERRTCFNVWIQANSF